MPHVPSLTSKSLRPGKFIWAHPLNFSMTKICARVSPVALGLAKPWNMALHHVSLSMIHVSARAIGPGSHLRRFMSLLMISLSNLSLLSLNPTYHALIQQHQSTYFYLNPITTHAVKETTSLLVVQNSRRCLWMKDFSSQCIIIYAKTALVTTVLKIVDPRTVAGVRNATNNTIQCCIVPVS